MGTTLKVRGGAFYSKWGIHVASRDGNDPYVRLDSYGVRVVSSTLPNTPRVLRGGSFNFIEGYLRAACRGWNFPGYRNGSDGFRVVVIIPGRQN